MKQNELNKIILKHVLWLKDIHKGYRAYLKDADLSFLNLNDVNLSNADLRGVNLSYASLNNTNFYNADLRNADLTGVDFTSTNLTLATGSKLNAYRKNK